ncbi:hypothetical protein [Methylobacterium oryzisoli]|uniref:hypothetical protein n=1 Tax=Methylobacterium oryzisoli TaxID=3385502 RepID=UPI003891F597
MMRTTLLAATAALSLIGAAQAETVKPARANSLDLGPLAGIAYYTVEPKGYRVVVTLAPRAAAPAIRFEAVLAAGQSVTLSTPRQAGATSRAVEISRDGDTVSITPASDPVQETASLR